MFGLDLMRIFKEDDGAFNRTVVLNMWFKTRTLALDANRKLKLFSFSSADCEQDFAEAPKDGLGVELMWLQSGGRRWTETDAWHEEHEEKK